MSTFYTRFWRNVIKAQNKIHVKYICLTKPAMKLVKKPLNHAYLRSKPLNQHTLIQEKMIFRLTPRFSTPAIASHYAKMITIGNHIAWFQNINLLIWNKYRSHWLTCFACFIFVSLLMSGSSRKATDCITFDRPLRHYHPWFWREMTWINSCCKGGEFNVKLTY